MARLLFLVDELPFPPRNGVTLPTFHYVTGLRASHRVDLALFPDPRHRLRQEDIEANRGLVERLWIIERRGTGWIRAGLDELAGRVPRFASGGLNREEMRRSFGDYDCDAIWASPIGPVARIRDVEGCLAARRRRLKIAAINDAYTGTLRSLGSLFYRHGFPWRQRPRYGIAWLRSWAMGPMERRLLDGADLIGVQSKADEAWVGRISRGKLTDRVVLLPNGVRQDLLDRPLSPVPKRFGYVGSLSDPLHIGPVMWIVNSVLPDLRKTHPDVEFWILGRRGDADLMRRLLETTGIRHMERVEKMEEFFGSVSAMIVWVYKRMGLINRTVEAMASGLAVIGDAGAFNGIEAFERDRHGFIARNASEAAAILKRLFSDEAERMRIGQNARDLMAKHFRWQGRIDRVNALIEEGIGGSL